MPKHFIYPIYTAVFAFILIATVPKKEIRRLAVYGIIFGAMMDVFALSLGKLTGLFGWINYGPFGFMGMSIFSNVSWGIYFILYFYFLPKQKPLNYIYLVSGVFFSILYTNLVIELGIFTSPLSRLLQPLIAFTIWFSTATWGYYRLTGYFAKQQQGRPKLARFTLSPQPARKTAGEYKKIKLRRSTAPHNK